MRKRFKVGMIASSDNYELSRRVYRDHIISEHNKNAEEVAMISVSVHVKKPYTRVFGTLVPLTLEEAKVKQINIIWQ